MFKEIVQESLHEVAENYRLVRVAFVTSFVHTIISLITVANYFTNILIYNFDIETAGAWDRVMILMSQFVNQGYFFELLVVGFLFVIAYYFIYPVGIGVMVSQLHQGKMGESMLRGFNAFGPLAIVHAAMSVLTISGQTVGIYMRIIAAEIAGSFLVQAVMVMIGIIILTGTILLPYALYVIMLEDIGGGAKNVAQESMAKSAALAAKNLWITIKFTVLSAVLQLRVVINIAILIFIPALFMYIALEFNLLGESNLNILMLISGGLLLLVITYINAIIDAFFTTYWYKLYMRIR